MTPAQLDRALVHLAWADSQLRLAQELIQDEPAEVHWIRKMRTVLLNRRQKLANKGR